MNTRSQQILPLVAGLPLLVVLPLVGAHLAGLPLAQYTEFPPLTRYVPHAAFSWPVFLALAAVIAGTVGGFVAGDLRALREAERQGARGEGQGAPSASELPTSGLRLRTSAFPLWAWFGLALGLVAWLLAWTRFAWFAPGQAFTFSPLWFAYILVVNGLSVRRTGRCLMTDRPGAFALLFPLSAAFWWFFEFLNRFVQNWYYVGVGDLTATQYVIFATLPFSTVLPAVLSTDNLLRSFPALGRGLDTVRPARPASVTARRLRAALVLAIAAASLAGIGVWPDWLFPLVWISPLLIMTSLQALAGQPTLFVSTARGDWRTLHRLALAALICGFFWEMWNYGSLARWIYAVPFVNRFHLFEMPVLGYAGYLPFGLECAIAAELVLAPWPRPPVSPSPQSPNTPSP